MNRATAISVAAACLTVGAVCATTAARTVSAPFAAALVILSLTMLGCAGYWVRVARQVTR